MGQTPADFPSFPSPLPYWPPGILSRPAPRPTWRTARLNVLLLVLTVLTVYLTGGVRLVVGLMSILMAHEMGHYLTCRYYGVDASLPYFIPGPPAPFGLVGTFGAFIRIRSPIPDRRALFDIGISGPLAGFAVCVPVLLLGMHEARFVPDPPPGVGLSLGDPLLLQFAAWLVKGEAPAGHTLALGPLGMAAWFGLLVTALNLMPIGQLDGGHVVYALLRRRAVAVYRLGLGLCLLLAWLRPSWLLWSLLVILLGRRHPATLDDITPIGRARVGIALLGVVVFSLCFTPNPILISWADLIDGFRR